MNTTIRARLDAIALRLLEQDDSDEAFLLKLVLQPGAAEPEDSKPTPRAAHAGKAKKAGIEVGQVEIAEGWEPTKNPKYGKTARIKPTPSPAEPATAKQKFCDEDDAKIREWFAEGVTDAEIAQRLGKKPAGVYWRRKNKLGLTSPTAREDGQKRRWGSKKQREHIERVKNGGGRVTEAVSVTKTYQENGVTVEVCPPRFADGAVALKNMGEKGL